MLLVNAAVDKSDMLSQIKSLPLQISSAYELGRYMRFEKEEIQRVIIAGMGGSGIAGRLIKSYFEDLNSKMPVHVVADYDLPSCADSKTLVFVVSYSGDTEESVNILKEAQKKSCKIVAITTNGRVKTMCDEKNISCVPLPKGMQPRAALPYLFFPMLRILDNSGIIQKQAAEVEKTLRVLSDKSSQEKIMKRAEQTAELLHEKITLIYASDRLNAVAYRWKTQINENAKTPAFYHVFPELDHNELNSFLNLPAKFHVVIIKEQGDHHRVKKRMEVTKNMIKKFGIDVSEAEFTNDSLLANMFAAIYLGDLTSYYLALLYNTDPTPVKAVEDFKKQLGKW